MNLTGYEIIRAVRTDLDANFFASPTTGQDPLTVQFTDTTSGIPGPDTWLWNFGDGYTSTAQNPSHIYLIPGQYSVHLTAQNDYGYDEIAKPYYITVNTQKVKPTADFSASRTTGPAPLTVTFTDESTGAPTSWGWEFGDGLGSNARNPTHTYIAPGTYTVILTAYNSVGSDVKTRTEYITAENIPQPADAGINGYAFDNTNNVLVDGATITIENDTYSDTNVTHGGGFYQFTALTGGTYTIKGEKAGYLPSPDYAVQLYSGAVVQRDIFLGVSGVAIVGTVYDATTGQKLNGANVTATQGTASYSSTGAGQYALNGLSKGVETTITATLPGYTHTPVTLTPTSSAPYTVDLYLIPDTIAHNGTSLAGLVTDAATHNAIPNAQVSIPGIPNATTSPTGFYLIDNLTPGSYYVTASASGYKDSPAAHAVTLTEGNLTRQDITLSPASTASTGYGAQYPPHNVKFVIRSAFGGPIEGVTVQATGYETTMGAWSWLYDLLGLDYEKTELHDQTMNGTTGTDGAIDFMMIEAIKYRVTFTKPDVINTTWEGYPKDEYYTIWASEFGASEWYQHGYNPLDVVTFTLADASADSSSASLTVRYNDTLGQTTAATVLLNQALTNGTEVAIDSYGVSTSAFNHTFVIAGDHRGESYLVRLQASHDLFGNVTRDYGVHFKPAPTSFGLPEDLLLFFAMGIMLFTCLCFGQSSVGAGCILLAFESWVFFWLGWLQDLGPDYAVGTVLIIISLVAVLVNVMHRSKKERYA